MLLVSGVFLELDMAGDVRIPRAGNSAAPMVFECGEVHINQSPTLEHVVCFGSTKSNPRRLPCYLFMVEV